MMSPVALYFASGESLYPGAFLLILTVVLSPFFGQSWHARVRNTLAWISLALILMACPPAPWLAYVGLFGAYVVWYLAVNRRGQTRSVTFKLKVTSAAALSVTLVAIAAVELSHRNMPCISGEPIHQLVVLGDSISSGLDSAAAPWPTIVQQKTGVVVKNVSQPGAHVVDGVGMAANLSPQDRVVLIELGGNDLLQDTPPSDFARALDKVLSTVAISGRTVAMFELPLLPHKIAYGRIQRRLAEKYGVLLVPKRFFAEILSGANATIDGLHLSDAGAHRMATLVTRLFTPPK